MAFRPIQWNMTDKANIRWRGGHYEGMFSSPGPFPPSPVPDDNKNAYHYLHNILITGGRLYDTKDYAVGISWIMPPIYYGYKYSLDFKSALNLPDILNNSDVNLYKVNGFTKFVNVGPSSNFKTYMTLGEKHTIFDTRFIYYYGGEPLPPHFGETIGVHIYPCETSFDIDLQTYTSDNITQHFGWNDDYDGTDDSKIKYCSPGIRVDVDNLNKHYGIAKLTNTGIKITNEINTYDNVEYKLEKNQTYLPIVNRYYLISKDTDYNTVLNKIKSTINTLFNSLSSFMYFSRTCQDIFQSNLYESYSTTYKEVVNDSNVNISKHPTNGFKYEGDVMLKNEIIDIPTFFNRAMFSTDGSTNTSKTITQESIYI